MKKSKTALPHLLSPAGNMECLKSAVSAGCDEVYFGGQQFNARQGAGNFSIEEMKEAVCYCRLRGVKTCLTVNTIVKESEWDDFIEAMDAMAATGIHAIIVQDMGVAEYVRQHYPQIELHGSTQMSIHSLEGALYLERHGFTRVVLSRELSLEEVRYIRERCSIELEVFIHGALCYSYSGQCLLSSLIGGRSGNRGRCAQPCRLPYTGEDGKDRHLMNLKDMCSLSLIPDLIQIGVDSLKIEGRLKGPEYVYGVTDAYRRALDSQLEDLQAEKTRLAQLFNRGGFTEGYWTSNPHMIEAGSPKHQGIRVGQVSGFRKGQILIRSDVELHPQDVLEIRTDKPPYPSYQLQNKNMMDQGCWITAEAAVRKGMDVYRLIDHQLVSALKENHPLPELPVSVYGEFHIGKPAILTAVYHDISVTAEGAVVQQATGRPMTEEDLTKQLRKTGGTAFTVQDLYITADPELFIPVSALNSLRREVLEQLDRAMTSFDADKSVVIAECMPQYRPQKDQLLEAVISDSGQWEAVKTAQIFTWFRMESFSMDALMQYTKEADALSIPWGISLPYIQKTQACSAVLNALEMLSKDCKVLVHNPGQLEMLRDSSHPCCLDFTIPVTNSRSLSYWLTEAENVTVSSELTARELQDLPKASAAAIVYGQIPVMLSEQCIRKEQDKCTKAFGYSVFKDRKNESWVCEHHCRSCYTAIYPSAPIWMADRSRVLSQLPVSRLRMMFLREAKEQVEFVIRQYKNALQGKSIEEPDFITQRGHFYKGIE